MEDNIFFNQSKYIKEMLKKFGLEDSKPTKTPMSTEIKLTKDNEADSVDSTKYRGMIRSLLYLTETDIRQKDKKSSKNGQNQARNGKAWKSQSQIEAKVQESQSPSQPRQSQSQKVIKSKKIQL
ncbi:hypothetical protein Tco_0168121 [Tanacetum coccineum]